MKTFLLLLLISFSTLASNYMPVSKIIPGAFQGFELQSSCEGQSGEACLDVHPEKVKLGFFSIEENQISYDESAYSAHLAAQAIIAQSAAEKEAALARMAHGRGVIALVIVQNSKKTLNNTQIASINSTFAQIKGLLETGSLNTAKQMIQAITPDGVLVTQADIDIYVAEINAYPGL